MSFNTQHGYDTEDTLKIWYLACVCVCGLNRSVETEPQNAYFISIWYFIANLSVGCKYTKVSINLGYGLEFKRQEKLGIGYKLWIVSSWKLVHYHSWVCHLNRIRETKILLLGFCMSLSSILGNQDLFSWLQRHTYWDKGQNGWSILSIQNRKCQAMGMLCVCVCICVYIYGK